MPIHFIELTEAGTHGGPLLLCVNHIIYLHYEDEASYLRIELVSGGFIEVQETYSEVKKKINTRTYIEDNTNAP